MIKFVAQSDEEETTKQRVKGWISKMEKNIADMIDNKGHTKLTRRAHSDISIDRLYQKSDKEIREVKIRDLFHSDSHPTVRDVPPYERLKKKKELTFSDRDVLLGRLYPTAISEHERSELPGKFRDPNIVSEYDRIMFSPTLFEPRLISEYEHSEPSHKVPDPSLVSEYGSSEFPPKLADVRIFSHPILKRDIEDEDFKSQQDRFEPYSYIKKYSSEENLPKDVGISRHPILKRGIGEEDVKRQKDGLEPHSYNIKKYSSEDKLPKDVRISSHPISKRDLKNEAVKRHKEGLEPYSYVEKYSSEDKFPEDVRISSHPIYKRDLKDEDVKRQKGGLDPHSDIKKYSSEDKLPEPTDGTTKADLAQEFSFSFIPKPTQIHKEPRQRVSSATLIKETKDMLDKRIIQEKLRQEEIIKEKQRIKEEKILRDKQAKEQRELHSKEKDKILPEIELDKKEISDKDKTSSVKITEHQTVEKETDEDRKKKEASESEKLEQRAKDIKGTVKKEKGVNEMIKKETEAQKKMPDKGHKNKEDSKHGETELLKKESGDGQKAKKEKEAQKIKPDEGKKGPVEQLKKEQFKQDKDIVKKEKPTELIDQSKIEKQKKEKDAQKQTTDGSKLERTDKPISDKEKAKREKEEQKKKDEENQKRKEMLKAHQKEQQMREAELEAKKKAKDSEIKEDKDVKSPSKPDPAMEQLKALIGDQLKQKKTKEPAEKETKNSKANNILPQDSKSQKIDEGTPDVPISKIKARRPSEDDLILRLIKLKQQAKKATKLAELPITEAEVLMHKHHIGLKHSVCCMCLDSDLELDVERITKNEDEIKTMDVIIGEEIKKYKIPFEDENTKKDFSPVLPTLMEVPPTELKIDIINEVIESVEKKSKQIDSKKVSKYSYA